MSACGCQNSLQQLGCNHTTTSSEKFLAHFPPPKTLGLAAQPAELGFPLRGHCKPSAPTPPRLRRDARPLPSLDARTVGTREPCTSAPGTSGARGGVCKLASSWVRPDRRAPSPELPGANPRPPALTSRPELREEEPRQEQQHCPPHPETADLKSLFGPTDRWTSGTCRVAGLARAKTAQSRRPGQPAPKAQSGAAVEGGERGRGTGRGPSLSPPSQSGRRGGGTAAGRGGRRRGWKGTGLDARGGEGRAAGWG